MIHLKDEEDTKKLGEIIANTITDGTVMALIGDLGSGKTTLSKSIIKNIIDEDDVSSPTFNIVNEYQKNNRKIYHFDLYRLEDEDELFGIGFDDYISDKKAIILIEWADKFISMLPKNYIRVAFVKNDDSRDVELMSIGGKNVEIVEKMLNQSL